MSVNFHPSRSDLSAFHDYHSRLHDMHSSLVERIHSTRDSDRRFVSSEHHITLFVREPHAPVKGVLHLELKLIKSISEFEAIRDNIVGGFDLKTNTNFIHHSAADFHRNGHLNIRANQVALQALNKGQSMDFNSFKTVIIDDASLETFVKDIEKIVTTKSELEKGRKAEKDVIHEVNPQASHSERHVERKERKESSRRKDSARVTETKSAPKNVAKMSPNEVKAARQEILKEERDKHERILEKDEARIERNKN